MLGTIPQQYIFKLYFLLSIAKLWRFIVLDLFFRFVYLKSFEFK